MFLHAYDTVFAATAGINRCVHFYNAERPHSSLGKKTPNEVYAGLHNDHNNDSPARVRHERTEHR